MDGGCKRKKEEDDGEKRELAIFSSLQEIVIMAFLAMDNVKNEKSTNSDKTHWQYYIGDDDHDTPGR